MNDLLNPGMEQAVLSCLMNWPEKCFPIVSAFNITPEHFQTPANRVLFDTVNHYWRTGKPIDLILMTNDLRDRDILPSIGGAYYVTETWLENCYTYEAIEYYIEVLVEAHAKRLLAISCGEILKEVKAPMVETEELVDSTIQRLSEFRIKPRKHRTMLEAVQELLERMERGEEAPDVIKTGISKIDDESKLRRGDMPLIVGKRKTGKSIMALSLAANVAKQGLPVLYFSLEDPERKVMERLFCGIARQPLPVFGTEAAEAGAILGALPIHIKDEYRDLIDIESVCRELKARCDIGLIIIDYAQVVRVKEQKGVNREQKVAEVSRTLRLLAIELDVPIIVLSQLNDDNQTRESRALEQDCTACWWIYKDKDEDAHSIRWIEIPYQRNGQSGIRFKVTFLGAIARVENYAP